MHFHLNYTPPKQGPEINHSGKVFMIGSCFSENIGLKLADHRFKITLNPNGILFNPSSIHNCLDALIHDKPADEKAVLLRDEVYFSYGHHSSIYADNQEELLSKINTGHKNSRSFLKEAQFLIITFGSAYIYTHKGLDKVVANCHKQPSQTFEKSMLRVENIVSDYTQLMDDLRVYNPDLKIIFTVSPVKYLKDGIIENNVSKSTLLLSIHQLATAFENCFYFPAYELVTDDLRDYRFYKQDLAHPNEQAIDYVWEKFSDCYFSKETIQLNQQISKLNTATNHRSMIHNSTEAIKLNDFINRQKAEIKKLNPEIEF